jgi:hypothetical protein
MRIPEKTVLGLGSALLLLSGIKGLVHVLDGITAAHMQAEAATMTSPESFRIGYEAGFGLVLAIELFAGLGLLAMLIARWRKPHDAG